MAQKYQNIPVKPETYARVKMLAAANNRGLGDQVSAWAEAELPECDHKKRLVTIETFGGGADDLKPVSLKYGWYCATCRRVYANITKIKEAIGETGAGKEESVACNAGADL